MKWLCNQYNYKDGSQETTARSQDGVWAIYTTPPQFNYPHEAYILQVSEWVFEFNDWWPDFEIIADDLPSIEVAIQYVNLLIENNPQMYEEVD